MGKRKLSKHEKKKEEPAAMEELLSLQELTGLVERLHNYKNLLDDLEVVPKKMLRDAVDVYARLFDGPVKEVSRQDFFHMEKVQYGS